ncbi:nicotinamide riboside transporter PnuC [Nakamurella silvestris]|nr:nicotinamide riboside transporter PnuC [Nakamurella silvestris]
MNTLVDFLNQALFQVWGNPVSLIEAVGFITGALCVWGVARQAIWNWPVGIANNIAFGFLFISAGLYAETILQAVFAVIAVYGWVAWSSGGRSAGSADAQLPVRRTHPREAWLLVALTAASTVVIALALEHGTDSTVPWPDAFVLAASLAATYGQARKILESWWVWILIDVVSVPLYVSRGLYLTAILYLGFLALCVLGLRNWQRDLSSRAVAPGAEPAEVLR